MPSIHYGEGSTVQSLQKSPPKVHHDKNQNGFNGLKARWNPQTPPKLNGRVNGVGQVANGGGQQSRANRKRRHVWMDVSDEEDEKRPIGKVNGAVINGVNGSPSQHANGHNKKRRKSLGAALDTKQTLLQEQRRQLPIAKGREALIEEIREHDVTVLLGETGSGKTTQVPQYLFESGICGTGMIAVTQPRRVAATSLASRVASEQRTSLGGLVGYSVRFDDVASPETRIKFMTDGMLVRELLSDPLLTRYSVIIVDEAHERTLRTDLLITKLKMIMTKRNGPKDRKGKGKMSEERTNPLKVVIMSATLDAEKFSKFYDNCKVLYVKGRQHPVKVYHAAVGQPDYVDAALRTFFQIHIDRPPGDVLIFLPGQEDIESLEKSIQLYSKCLPTQGMGVCIYPMFAALPPGQQSKIFQPPPHNTRKCILATNIAETSITIPGITYVIDTGKHKEKRYVARDTGSGFDALLTRDITKSSAMQRAGRAGREGKGFCFRLYTEEAFDSMAMSSDPEILRTSLTSAALQLKCLGEDIEGLDFLDKPDVQSIHSALKTLWFLGALDNTKSLTSSGRDMATFPLEPSFACAVLESVKQGCTLEVLDVVSLLSSSSKLFFDISDERDTASEARRKFRHSSGDHMTMANALRAYQDIVASDSSGKAACRDWCRKNYLNERTLLEAMKIREQLRGTCEKMGINWRVSSADNERPVLKSLLRGLVLNSAFLQPDGVSYRQVVGRALVKIHPSSMLADQKAPAIIYDELVFTNHIYARGVSAVPKSFLAEVSARNQVRT